MRDFITDFKRPIIVVGVIVVLLAVGIWFAVNAGNECAEAGGTVVTTGYVPIAQKVGDAVIVNNVPIQECRVEN